MFEIKIELTINLSSRRYTSGPHTHTERNVCGCDMTHGKHVSRYVSLTRRFLSVVLFSHSRQTWIPRWNILLSADCNYSAQITHSCGAINLTDGGSASTFCKERKMTKIFFFNYSSHGLRMTSCRNLWTNCARRFTYKWIRRLESNWVELSWAEWMNRRDERLG